MLISDIKADSVKLVEYGKSHTANNPVIVSVKFKQEEYAFTITLPMPAAYLMTSISASGMGFSGMTISNPSAKILLQPLILLQKNQRPVGFHGLK
jgi:hypothetical protein